MSWPRRPMACGPCSEGAGAGEMVMVGGNARNGTMYLSGRDAELGLNELSEQVDAMIIL